MNRTSWQLGLVFVFVVMIVSSLTGNAWAQEEEPSQAPNPGDYYLEEAIAGSLGAGAGEMIGGTHLGVGGAMLCISLGGGLGCAWLIYLGKLAGTTVGAVSGVALIGAIRGVQGNLSLAAIYGALGWVTGFVGVFVINGLFNIFHLNIGLDANVTLFLMTLGAGFGAAAGYNLGAEMKTRQTSQPPQPQFPLVALE